MKRLLLALAMATSVSADPRGAKIVEAALQTLGGRAAIEKQEAWLVEGKGRENLSAELQGVAPGEPTWRPHEERIAVLRSSSAVAWERRTPRNDQSVRWRRFIQTAEGTGVVDYVTGSGSMRAGGTAEIERHALMRRIPHLLLLEVATRARSADWREARTIGGAPHDVVEVKLADAVRPLTLFFTRSPVLLARLEYATDLPGLGETRVGWEWSGWKSHPRLARVPSGHRVDVGGATFQEVTYSRFDIDAITVAELLKVPENLKKEAHREVVAAAGPAAGEVAPGVHVAEVRGFNVIFMELAESVVVFDAPASAVSLERIPGSGAGMTQHVANGLIAAIRETCPGKPISHIVVSHHHGDHIGGLATLLSSTDKPVKVLVAPGDAALAARAVGGRKDVTIEPVASRAAIGEGSSRIEIINIGANPHTRENLFVWLPAPKIVLDGDLFYFDEGSPFPPSGRQTMNRFFAGWLREHAITPERIYGVHYSGAAGAAALARALEPALGPHAALPFAAAK